MIKILVSKSKNFNKQLEYYLSIRRQTNASKLSVVKPRGSAPANASAPSSPISLYCKFSSVNPYARF